MASGCADTASQRSDLDLVEAFVERDDDVDWPYLDSVDVTGDVCVGEITCVQAVRSEFVTVLRFAAASQAQYYTAALGGQGAQLDSLVIEFRDGDLSVEQRLEVIRAVAGMHVSEVE